MVSTRKASFSWMTGHCCVFVSEACVPQKKRGHPRPRLSMDIAIPIGEDTDQHSVVLFDGGTKKKAVHSVKASKKEMESEIQKVLLRTLALSLVSYFSAIFSLSHFDFFFFFLFLLFLTAFLLILCSLQYV